MKTIYTFVNDIISYLDRKFAADNRFASAKKPTGKIAFDKSLIEKNAKSFYVVQIMPTNPRDESFNNVLTLTVPLQIDAFALKGTVGGSQYTAEQMSIVLQEIISNYMLELKYNREKENKNICLMREVTASPALPFEDGARAYQASLRYEFVIMKDYKNVNSN